MASSISSPRVRGTAFLLRHIGQMGNGFSRFKGCDKIHFAAQWSDWNSRMKVDIVTLLPRLSDVRPSFLISSIFAASQKSFAAGFPFRGRDGEREPAAAFRATVYWEIRKCEDLTKGFYSDPISAEGFLL